MCELISSAFVFLTAKDGIKSPVRSVVPRSLLQHQSSRKSSGVSCSILIAFCKRSVDSKPSRLQLDFMNLLITLSIHFCELQGSRSGKTSRVLSGAASTEDPTSTGSENPNYSMSGSLPIMAGASGSYDGSLKGKGTKSTMRWSGLFGSNYKVSLIVMERSYTCCSSFFTAGY